MTDGRNKVIYAGNKWQLVDGQDECFDGNFQKVACDNKKFIRETRIEEDSSDPDNKKQITVTVSWDSKKVELVDYLTNWKP